MDALERIYKKELEHLDFLQNELFELVDLLNETEQHGEIESVQLAYQKVISVKMKLTCIYRLATSPITKSEEEILKEIARTGKNTKRHVDYHVFIEKLRSINFSLDTKDVSIQKTQHSFICPITQSRLVDPVTNRACGHTYSELAFKDYLKTRVKICPVVGCKAVVSENSVFSDEKIKNLLLDDNR